MKGKMINLFLQKPYTILLMLTLVVNGNLMHAHAEDIVISSDTIWDSGTYTYGDVLVTNNATLTFNGTSILNATNLTIDAGASISANGKGYSPANGPGIGSILYGDWGAGYGGKGGNGQNSGDSGGGPAYGSAMQPTDLGSGGGYGYDYINPGGSGGGAIKLNVSKTLIINGQILSNGSDGSAGQWNGGGGGSGGSIYIITKAMAGNGSISTNGGRGAEPWGTPVWYRFRGGGGAGGRIAIYYQNSTFNGNTEANGGAGWGNSENGTIVLEPMSLENTQITLFNLTERSFTTTTLYETLLNQEIFLNNINVTGDLEGTFNFTEFEIVKITSGAFSEKGFFKGEYEANLEGIIYKGIWKGAIYPDPKERKIHLKGRISGVLKGIAETVFTESIPESGIYDKYESTWKLNLIGTDITSATLNLEGNLSYQSSYPFSSEIYLYQADFEGSCTGHYIGPLNAIVTHLRLTSEGEYQNEGFSISSYNTNLGSGEGWFYDESLSSNIIEFEGLFKGPLLGDVSATLNENISPKTLTGTIERLDFGLPPVPDLKVIVWGPTRIGISPGEKVTYIVEYRNDGVKVAENVFVSCLLDAFEKHIYASPGVHYSPYAHRLTWKISNLPPKTSDYLTFQVEVMWGLPVGYLLTHYAYITYIEPHSEIKGLVVPGSFTDSTDSYQVEILEGIAKTFDTKVVWTYNKTTIIDAPLHAKAAGMGIPTSVNGLDEPLLSKLSGQQEIVIAHSAGTRTVVTLAKEGNAWGDKLYLVSPALISQEELRTIRDLTAEGKGFNEIIVYTGDDMFPDKFKKIQVDFTSYLYSNVTLKQGDREVDFPVGELFYTTRGLPLAVYIGFLEYYSSLMENTIGKAPGVVTIFGDIPGNRFVITYEDDTTEIFNLQKDALTDKDFQAENGIKVIPLLEGIPHDLVELVALEKFYKKNGRMPETVEDIKFYRKFVEEIRNELSTAHDPNQKFVSPEGNIQPGDKLDYTLKYENEGEGIAFGVYITDTLDEDLNDSTLIIENNGSYDPEIRTITWFMGEVGPGEEGSVNFSVNVKADAQENAEIINFATVYFPSVPEATRTNGTLNRIVTIIDSIPPATTATFSPPPNVAGWNNTDVTINLTATDNTDGSGVKGIHYKLTGVIVREETIPDQTVQIFLISEGLTTLTYWAVDNAGNIESAKSVTVKIDKTQPIITGQISPEPNASDWNNTDVTVTFIATDALSGVVSVTGPITITTEGVNQNIGGETIDIAGNRASTYITLNIDKTPPIVNIIANPDILWPPNHKMVDVAIGGKATDSLSGIISTSFKVTDEYGKIEPNILNFNSTIQLEAWRDGNDSDGRIYNISVTTKDKADNEASSSTMVICPHDQRKK